MKLDAVLALEDGTTYRGYGFGAETEKTGEVVFNTEAHPLRRSWE